MDEVGKFARVSSWHIMMSAYESVSGKLFLGDDEGVDFDWLAGRATEAALAGVQRQDRLSDIEALRDFSEGDIRALTVKNGSLRASDEEELTAAGIGS